MRFPGRQKGRLLAAIAIAVATGATVLSACGSGGGNASSSGSSSSGGSSTSMTTLRIGYATSSPNLQDIALWVASDQGFFAKQHIKVKISYMNGESLVQQALLANRIDIGIGGDPVFYQGIQNGSGLKIFLEPAPTQQYMLMANKSVKTFAQAAGKKLGISSPGNISQLLPLIDLQDHGVNISTVQSIAVGGSGERAKSLVAGTTQLAVVGLPTALTLAESGSGVSILDNLGTDLKGFKFEADVTSGSYIKSHRSVLVGYATALLEATQYVLDHKAAAVSEYMSLVKGVDKADVEKSYDMLVAGGGFDPKGGLSEADYETTAKALVKFKVLNRIPPYSEVYDTSIRDAALKAISASTAG